MSHSNLLIIGFVWPEPRSSAAGSRMLQLMHQFQKQGFKITFATTANDSENAFDLSKIDVKIAKIKINDSSFNNFIKELNPDVVLFDRFMTEEQFGWRVTEECPNALKILDTEDFHGLRKGRAEALKKGVEFSTEYLQNDTTKREIASIYRSDLSLIISEAEMEIFTNQFKIDKSLLYYLPFLEQPIPEDEIANLPRFEERQHFISIGNFLHAPNYDAVLYLKNSIWPLIKKELPKAELHVYGAYVSQKVLQLHNEKNAFLIKGFVEDVNVAMQNSRVLLAPLRFGAGLKGKLIDAMKNGTPCAMSSIAAEGMFGTSTTLNDQNEKPNGYVTDVLEEFVLKAVELYKNGSLWNQNQKNGFNILNNRFNISNFETQFQEKINALLHNLIAHRQENFIGQLLSHHTMQSKKYMSKWIEEKNKNS